MAQPQPRQLPLAGTAFFFSQVQLIDDLGQVSGPSAECAHSARGENLQTYIIKGPSLSPNHPYVAANELISAALATYLALPVLPHAVGDMGGSLYFGSAWMEADSFYPVITKELFDRSENRDRVYPLIVFDAWLRNPDRHEWNLVARRMPAAGTTERIFLLLNDHSRCILEPGNGAARLYERMSDYPIQCIRLSFVADAVTDVGGLREALDRVESIPPHIIAAVVHGVPELLLSRRDAQYIVDFLLERRARLRTMLERERARFPNLGAEPL